MAIENDFLPFAVGAGANVLPQADYLALAAVSLGFQSGTAQSAACNKVWRQSSVMAAVLAQFIVARSGQAAVDDGTTATLLSNLLASSAALNGDPAQVFAVATATAPNQAVNLGQLALLKTVAPFSRSGLFTVPAGVYTIWVSGVAAGGGGAAGASTSGLSSRVGGGGGGGGACGQYLMRAPFSVLPGQVINIVIGAGGFGGIVGGAAATAGGNTVIGTLATLTGGSPGGAGAVATVNALGGGGNGGLGGAGGKAAQGAGQSGTGAAFGGGGGCYGSGPGTAGNGGVGGQGLVIIEC